MNNHGSEVSDENLMLAYQGGDRLAFETLLTRHKSGIYNFLYRFIGSKELAEEAFQEVFVRVIKSAENYSPQAKFTTWVYTIARNYCIDQSRKNRLRKVTSLDEKDRENEMSLADKIPDEKANPADDIAANQMMGHLERILNEMNPDQKEVFLLRERQGLPFEDIAKVVGSSINTVKSRMRYALLLIQDEFKKLGFMPK